MESRALAAAVMMAAVGLAACEGSSDDAGPATNAPPTIGAIADQVTTANRPSMPIAFKVSDERPDLIELEGSSDDQAVIPDTGLEITGNGEERQLIVSPIVDTVGTALVTITATDGQGLSARSSFRLAVEPQRASMQQFSRANFGSSADDEPTPVNAIEITQDAANDDFADLLAR